MAVSRKLCGAVIGQKGQTIRDFMLDSGATIRVQVSSEGSVSVCDEGEVVCVRHRTCAAWIGLESSGCEDVRFCWAAQSPFTQSHIHTQAYHCAPAPLPPPHTPSIAHLPPQPLSELTPSDSERLITVSGGRDKVLRAVALILNTVSRTQARSTHARSSREEERRRRMRYQLAHPCWEEEGAIPQAAMQHHHQVLLSSHRPGRKCPVVGENSHCCLLLTLLGAAACRSCSPYSCLLMTSSAATWTSPCSWPTHRWVIISPGLSSHVHHTH